MLVQAGAQGNVKTGVFPLHWQAKVLVNDFKNTPTPFAPEMQPPVSTRERNATYLTGTI